jgi:hypothetical protein
MLIMTDPIDGFLLHQQTSSCFPMYNQAFALSVCVGVFGIIVETFLASFHPETPDEKLAVSDSERRDFSSRPGNQGIARRRTSVRRTSKPED